MKNIYNSMSTKTLKEFTDIVYYNHISYLRNMILNKVVKNSIVGPSGYILQFTDNTFVVSYLEDDKLTWLLEDDVPNPLHLYLIDFDSEAENNALSLESLKGCSNEIISDVKIHENTFSLCFFSELEIKCFIESKNFAPILKLSIIHS